MPKANKGPSQWYARAIEYRAISDAMTTMPRRGHTESKIEFDERVSVFHLVKRQLLRESEKCWAKGGEIEFQRNKRKEKQS